MIKCVIIEYILPYVGSAVYLYRETYIFSNVGLTRSCRAKKKIYGVNVNDEKLRNRIVMNSNGTNKATLQGQ